MSDSLEFKFEIFFDVKMRRCEDAKMQLIFKKPKNKLEKYNFVNKKKIYSESKTKNDF